MKRHLLVLGCLALSAAAWGQAGGTSYPILFDRPFQEGRTFNIYVQDSTRTTQKSTVPDGTSTTTHAYNRFEIKGELTVKQIDAKGLEAQSELVVASFTRIIGDPDDKTLAAGSVSTRPAPMLAAGAKITISYVQSSVAFSIDKGTLSTDAKAGLAELFKGHAADDERFAPPAGEKKKVGDHWPINVDVMATALKTQGITPDKISGDVALKSANAVDGVPCTQVEVKMTIKDMPVSNLPPGAAAKESTLDLSAISDLPVDGAVARRGQNVTSKTHVVVETSPNGAGVVTSTVDLEKTRVMTLVPKK